MTVRAGWKAESAPTDEVALEATCNTPCDRAALAYRRGSWRVEGVAGRGDMTFRGPSPSRGRMTRSKSGPRTDRAPEVQLRGAVDDAHLGAHALEDLRHRSRAGSRDCFEASQRLRLRDGAVESVLGASASTFAIEDHHYALVHVTDLEPGEAYPYSVELDGRPA